ncbi:MAG: hypothetical protein GY861_14530 [bacterium]|nr:hypothetical protein [bacterium]
MVGDMAGYGRALNDLRQDRHNQWFDENTWFLDNCGVGFMKTETAYLFRDPKKPKCDFYPHTGRWRKCSNPKKTYRGGAESFINWYKKQRKEK